VLARFSLTPAAPLDELQQRLWRQRRDDCFAWRRDSVATEVTADLGAVDAYATHDRACQESAVLQTQGTVAIAQEGSSWAPPPNECFASNAIASAH
jgi:hypothetical protein